MKKPNGLNPHDVRALALMGIEVARHRLQELEASILGSVPKARIRRTRAEIEAALTTRTPRVAPHVSRLQAPKGEGRRRPRTPEQKARMAAAQQARWKTKKQIERGVQKP